MSDIISNRPAFEPLMQRSNAKGLLQLAGHSAVLATTALMVSATRDTCWLVPALLLHGVALVFLFAALHESIHRTAFASRRLNNVVAWVCGALLVLPPRYFRAYHMAHHRFTQQPDRDPELAVPKPATLGAYLWYVSGLPYWAERLRTTLRHAACHRTLCVPASSRQGRAGGACSADRLRPAGARLDPSAQRCGNLVLGRSRRAGSARVAAVPAG